MKENNELDLPPITWVNRPDFVEQREPEVVTEPHAEDDYFVVLTGDEFGLNIDGPIQFLPGPEADKLYLKYANELGCAVMLRVTPTALLPEISYLPY